MPGGQGAVAAAPYWGEYMKQAHGSYCGNFPQPKEPFQPVPFFGRYARGGVVGNSTSSSGYYTNSGTSSPSTQSTQSTGQGGQTYDPSLYSSPPQQAPQTQTPPAAPPANSGQGGVQAPPGH
jgi:penicillin-binding protein 1A